MQNVDKIKAQYEANKVSGRSQWCPRIGFYKLRSLTNGLWLKQPALIALVNWKLTGEEEFDEELYFVIQVESLRKTNPLFDFHSHIGSEINVTAAIYLRQPRIFAVEWQVVIDTPFAAAPLDTSNHSPLQTKEEEPQLTTVEKINKALKEGAVFSLSEIDEYDDYDESEDNDYFEDEY